MFGNQTVGASQFRIAKYLAFGGHGQKQLFGLGVLLQRFC